MKVGIVGCGKLGLPVAAAMDHLGHDVMCTDIVPERMQKDVFPHREGWPFDARPFDQALRESGVHFGTYADLVDHSDIIFVAVQTPHHPAFEGITALPSDRVDFNYDWLENAIEDLAITINRYGKPKVVVIISTVLPGTIRGRILPAISPLVKIAYNPYFIAMGTVVADFIQPEFVLFGHHDDDAAKLAKEFYQTICPAAPVFSTSIENAELIKVSYNTFISMKIAYINTLMEICDKMPGLDIDQVSQGLALGTRRLLSPMYLKGGMGDGGGCHPRDNIAMSWLARKLELSFDFFESIMTARENQTNYLAELAWNEALRNGLDIRILGTAFKANTNLNTGSPALLLKEQLEQYSHYTNYTVLAYDPLIDSAVPSYFFLFPAVFVIGCKHDEFVKIKFPAGSIVIDPHRYIPAQEGVTVRHVGVGK